MKFGALIAATVVLGVAGSAAAASDSCVALSRLKSTKAIDNRTIIATMRGRDDFRKITLASSCAGLKFHNGFAYDTPEPRLCKGEIITVIRTGSSCGIADIERMDADEARQLLAANKR